MKKSKLILIFSLFAIFSFSLFFAEKVFAVSDSVIVYVVSPENPDKPIDPPQEPSEPSEPSLQMTGSLSPSSTSCTILAGQNSCNVLFDWVTTNPVSVSSVTRDPSSGFTVKSGNNGNDVSLEVTYPSSNFYLYNNSVKLDEEKIISSCASGSSWNSETSKCVENLKLNYLRATDCEILEGDNFCNTSLSWDVFFPSGSFSLVTPVGKIVSTKYSETNIPYKVEYPSRSFYLYHNTEELSQVKATASCKSGLVWNNDFQKCEKEKILQESFYFNASDCEIKKGESSCSSLLNWNFILTPPFSITTPQNVKVSDLAQGVNVAYKVEYPSRNFYVYNKGNLLQTSVARANCSFDSSWSDTEGKCVDMSTLECSAPLTQTVSVGCDADVNGRNAISGSVIRLQKKTEPSCVFGEPVTPDNSIYVSDSCVYPLPENIEDDEQGDQNDQGENQNGDGGGGQTDAFWSNPVCGQCDPETNKKECTRYCDHDPSSGKFCSGDLNKDGIWLYPLSCGQTEQMLDVAIEVFPQKIIKGRKALLVWNSNADSCVATSGQGFNTGGFPKGEIEIQPESSITYEIQCTRGTTKDKKSVIIKVSNINIKES